MIILKGYQYNTPCKFCLHLFLFQLGNIFRPTSFRRSRSLLILTIIIVVEECIIFPSTFLERRLVPFKSRSVVPVGRWVSARSFEIDESCRRDAKKGVFMKESEKKIIVLWSDDSYDYYKCCNDTNQDPLNLNER